MNRKEYDNRWDAELVNPGFTMEEYEANKSAIGRYCANCNRFLLSDESIQCYPCAAITGDNFSNED